MNIVNSGSTFQIYDESVKTYKKLPVGCYTIQFDKLSGFSLKAHPTLAVLEEKIYGTSEAKVDKILKSYKLSDRNFGVILSGDKGVGKSLFAKIIANKANKMGISVILALHNYPGIEDFISSIEEEAIVLFDEFEKNFPCEYEYDPDDYSEIGAEGGTQNALLSLFDGVDNGKKLFIITCNDTYKLNKYFLNRPGRFHYHFRLSNPTGDEITEYLSDKLEAKYKSIIPTVVSLSALGSVTYDCLRAIAFDINQGYSLDETLDCLNLTRDRTINMGFAITLDNGEVFKTTENIDIFSQNRRGIYFYNECNGEIKVNFIPSDIHYENGKFILDKNRVNITYYSAGDSDIRPVNDAIAPKRGEYKPNISSIKIEKVDEGFIYKYII